MPRKLANGRQQGLLEPLSPAEEVEVAIKHGDVRWLAKWLRQAVSIEQPLLATLADLLDGDVKANPDLAQKYPYRLVTAPWGRPGPKPKGSVAKAKPNSSYQKKRKRGDPNVQPSDLMLALRVRKKLAAGAKTGAAIVAVAEECGRSESSVEKAYRSNRERIRRVKPAR